MHTAQGSTSAEFWVPLSCYSLLRNVDSTVLSTCVNPQKSPNHPFRHLYQYFPPPLTTPPLENLELGKQTHSYGLSCANTKAKAGGCSSTFISLVACSSSHLHGTIALELLLFWTCREDSSAAVTHLPMCFEVCSQGHTFCRSSSSWELIDHFSILITGVMWKSTVHNSSSSLMEHVDTLIFSAFLSSQIN
jgi:hypothetical protein